MNCKRNSMSHPEPRQTVDHGEHSPTPEGETLFLGFKISTQLEQKRGKEKKAVPNMMSVFPLLHRETMFLSYFKDEILVLIFLPVVCARKRERRGRTICWILLPNYENIKSLHQLRSGKQLGCICRECSSQANSTMESSLHWRKPEIAQPSQPSLTSTVLREKSPYSEISQGLKGRKWSRCRMTIWLCNTKNTAILTE